MSEYAAVAVVVSVAAGAGAYFMQSADNNKKKKPTSQKVVEVVEDQPHVKVAQVEGAPNEKRRKQKADAAARKANSEKARLAAANAEFEKQKEAVRMVDARAKKESEKLRLGNLAAVAQAKADRKKELDAIQRARDAERKTKEAEAKKNKVEQEKLAKVKEQRRAENKAKEADNEKRRIEKAAKLAERSAKRKKQIADDEQAARESKQREEEVAIKQAEEDAAVRKAELELEQAKLSKSANWNKSSEEANARKAEKAAKHIQKKQAKIEKAKAKALVRQQLGASLIQTAPREDALSASSVEAKGAFTIERAVPNGEEQEEEEQTVPPVKEEAPKAEEPKAEEPKAEEPKEEEAKAEEPKEEEAKEEVKADDAALETVEQQSNDNKKEITDAQSRLNAIKARADSLQKGKATETTETERTGNGLKENAATQETTATPTTENESFIQPLTDKDWKAKPQAMYTTYDNDVSIGKTCPEFDTLEFIKDGPVAVGDGKTTVIVFFAKFAKGDYTTVVGVNRLKELFPDIQFFGILYDPEKADAQGFVKKIGTAMPEIYIDNLVCDYPLAWDNGKVVKEAFRKTAALMTLTASAIFVVGGNEKIVWREQFGPGYPPKMGQLGEQLRRHLAGEKLLSNGDKPVVEEGSDDEDPNDGIDMGDDDYDSDLGF